MHSLDVFDIFNRQQDPQDFMKATLLHIDMHMNFEIHHHYVIATKAFSLYNHEERP